MTYQHVTTWVFLAVAVAGAGGAALGIWAGPRASVRLLSGLGVYCAALAVLYITLASGLPAATAAHPHVGLWAPEMIAAVTPTLGTVTVGSLAVWVALVTAERSRLATFDWSESEIFGLARIALINLDAALEPLRTFLLTTAATAGRDMLHAAWAAPTGGPKLGPELLGARRAVETALPAGRREALTRALGLAEAALIQLAAAGIRIGAPLQSPDEALGSWLALDGDVAFLRDLLRWADQADRDNRDDRDDSDDRDDRDDRETASARGRLVFLLARAAAAADQSAAAIRTAGDDPQWKRLLDPAWLARLMQLLEDQRRSDLPPRSAEGDAADLGLVSEAWDAFVRSRLARRRLIARLDEADPARAPSRPFAAPVHGQLWDAVIGGWRADLLAEASAHPGAGPWPALRPATLQALLPTTGGRFTIAVPAPDDAVLTQEAVAVQPGTTFILGTLELGFAYLTPSPEEIWPQDLRLWAVTEDARWHLLPTAAEALAPAAPDLEAVAPLLAASWRSATRAGSAQTLWVCPEPLAKIGWWVASWDSNDESRQSQLHPATSEG
jgi:hypothetical protein